MGIFSFLVNAIVMLIIAAAAFIIIDVASQSGPDDPIVQGTTDDVRTGLSFLHRPVDENTFTYSLLGLVGLLILYGAYRIYRGSDSDTGGA